MDKNTSTIIFFKVNINTKS